MERGMEQLILVALLLLGALVDLIIRWGRRKSGGQTAPPEIDEESVYVEDFPEDYGREEDERPVPTIPAPQRSIARVAMSAAEEAPRAKPVLPPPPVVRRRRSRHPLLDHPIDPRRAVILMAVLGPCKGLEPPQTEG